MLSPRPCHLVKGDTETDKETDKEEEKVKEKEEEKVKKEEKDKEEQDGDPSPGSVHLAAPSWVTEIRQNELFRKVRQKIDTD